MIRSFNFIRPSVKYAVETGGGGVTPIYAYPISDISVGDGYFNWMKYSDDSTSNLYSIIGGTSPCEDDFLYQYNRFWGDVPLICGLTSLTDPNKSTGHKLTWRGFTYGGMSTHSNSFLISLMQGTTAIFSMEDPTRSTDDDGFVTSSYTLSANEADAITDYTDLRVKVTAQSAYVGHCRLSWVRFEVPE